MNFINPPANAPENVFHKIFYSKLYERELGYNIYLPPGYEREGAAYPVEFHLHAVFCHSGFRDGRAVHLFVVL